MICRASVLELGEHLGTASARIVDSAENIARLAREAEAMIGTGVLAVSEVRARRVRKPGTEPDGIAGIAR